MNLLDYAKFFIDLVGVFTTIFAVLIFIWGVISWIIGAYPIFYRIGFGRWSRKITIAANDDMYNVLKIDLVDTGIFREKNIAPRVVANSSFAKIKEASLVLVHYQSFTEDEIKTILSYKKSHAGFIFYFPEFSPPNHVISPAMMKIINNEQFTTVVNMRGRLMNDIVTTLLSTGYEKR